MEKDDRLVIEIPYDKEGSIDWEEIEAKSIEYKEKGLVVSTGTLPHTFAQDTILNDAKSTIILRTSASPGCLEFIQEGVYVKFCHPLIPD